MAENNSDSNEEITQSQVESTDTNEETTEASVDPTDLAANNVESKTEENEPQSEIDSPTEPEEPELSFSKHHLIMVFKIFGLDLALDIIFPQGFTSIEFP